MHLLIYIYKYTYIQNIYCLYVCECVLAKLLQLRPTLCDPMDSNPPGSPVHGVLQARILERVATPSSRGVFLTQGSRPPPLCRLHLQAGSLPLASLGKPIFVCVCVCVCVCVYTETGIPHLSKVHFMLLRFYEDLH